jgi:hypothetical protein
MTDNKGNRVRTIVRSVNPCHSTGLLSVMEDFRLFSDFSYFLSKWVRGNDGLEIAEATED